MKITFQPIKSKDKHYVYARLNLKLKTQDSTLHEVVQVGKKTITEHRKVVKYKSVYVSTGIKVDDLAQWNAKERRFFDSAKNTQLDNIQSLIEDIVSRNKNIIDVHNLELIQDLIKKLVFNKTSREFKLMIQGNSIIDTQIHYNPDTQPRHKERYQYMPRIEGEIESVVEQLNELMPGEKEKVILMGMPLYKFIETTYKGWQESGKKGFDSARTYRNSMSWVLNFEKANKKRVRVKDFNQSFVESFMLWAKSQVKKDSEPYAVNYISEIRKQLQVIDSELKLVHNIHSKIVWENNKTLKKTKEKSVDVALNEEQIKEILAYKVPKMYTDKKGIVRPTPQGKFDALALIKVGIFTGMRQIDLNNLNLVEKGNDLYVDQTLQKVGHVRFLVHPVVREVWLSYNKKLPSLEPQTIGDYFREIGEEIGWNHEYTYTRRNPGAGKKVITKNPKFFSMLRTSTLRRTFASMAINTWNLPISEISKVLGHSNIKQTMEYIRVDESALNKKLKAKYQEL